MTYWLSTRLFKFYFTLFYRLQIRGLEHLPKGAAIIAPNHTSFFDPPLICAAIPEEVEFLARENLFSHSLFGGFIRALNAHPIKRGEGDLAAFKMMTKLLQEGKKVVIFPEGRRSSDGQLGPLQTGAARLALRTQAPLLPVHIEGCFKAWPRQKKWPRLFGRITCTFLAPINPAPFASLPKHEQPDALTEVLARQLHLFDRSPRDVP